MKKYDFKKDFFWGVATAAYQIEGAKDEDGKGESIWDVFTHKYGTVRDGSNGDVACDSYHRLEEDLALLEESGVTAYRFSVSWPRILPKGTGKVNLKGIEYYNRLIDGLLARGITPFLTLYHWDMPQALNEKGGFLNREFADWFEEYAEVIKKYFGDRVKYYFTFNEGENCLGAGFAPGYHYGAKEQLKRIHHLLLAHGKAARVLHTIPGAKVGYAACAGLVPCPLTDSPDEYKLAKEGFFVVDRGCPHGGNAIYLDPMLKGRYPECYEEYFAEIMPDIQPGDMEIIGPSVDFLAVNVYDGRLIKAKRTESGEVIGPEPSARPWGAATSTMGCYITPESIYYSSKFLYEEYHLPVYVSENGIALADFLFSDGKVHDPARGEYIRLYLDALERAKKDGVEVDGYFYWSFLDNFEWSFGYTQRYGLVYVDYENGNRTPKDSFYEYKKIITESRS